MNTKFLKTLLFITTTIVFISCDKDFNNVGDNLINTDHYGMEMYAGPLTVNAYTKLTGPIDSKNLDVNPLGIYKNPVFGTTTANFVTQVQLASVAPTIDLALNQTVTNVVLYIPYFSRNTGANSNGAYTYELDSIVNKSNINNKIKLSVFENGYDMSGNDTDTQFTEGKRLYTNQNNLFNSLKIGVRLNDDNIDTFAQNDNFIYSKSEHKVIFTSAAGVATTSYVAPGMRLNLNKNYFKNLLFTTASGTTTANLTTNAVFMERLKGLYFKTEQSGTDDGCMSILNFRKGTITVNYTEKTSATDGTLVDKSIVINLSGNTVSLLEHTPVGGSLGVIANGNPTTGDAKLFLKGGEGSIGMINLFLNKDASNNIIDNIKFDRTTKTTVPGSNGIADELDEIKAKGWLINEANLVFTIDNNTLGTTAVEPNRLLLYDTRNHRPLYDYYVDNTTKSYANSGKVVHDGMIFPRQNATVTPRGTKYTIHITDHIRNIINKDSTNVTLGLAVCQSINNQFFARQKNLPSAYPIWMGLPANEKNQYYYPTSSVMNPLGTILYGTNYLPADADYNKRVQLEIWYTKPD
jgi:hypothetical protein